MILPLMHSNGLPTISVIFCIIQITEKLRLMAPTVKMMSKKFLSMSQNFKKRNFKEKPEAEWEFLKKFLALLTKNK